MANINTAASPNQNIAAKEALAIQTAETRIKQLIVEARYKGIPKAQLSKQIAQVIAETAQVFTNQSSKQQIRQALALNAQRWNYLYQENLDVINAAMASKMANFKPENIDQNIQVKKTSYTVDITNMQPAISEFRNEVTVDKAGLAIIQNYEKQVRAQMSVLAADPANLHRIDKNGNPYKVHLRNFAEMEVRYRASMEDVKRLKDNGVALVWTTSHPDSSGRCAPYQGRLYSLDGTRGEQNGIKYEPIDDALMGPKGDGNGIINGYNCRHRLVEYTPGSKAPTEYDTKTIRRENAINARQRAMEREIRLVKTQKRLAKAGGLTQLEASLEKKQAMLEKSYQNFSIKNGRAFYSWRTTVGHEEFKWIKDDVQLPPIPNYALAGSQPVPAHIIATMEPAPAPIVQPAPAPVLSPLEAKLAAHHTFTPKPKKELLKPQQDPQEFAKIMSKTTVGFKSLLNVEKLGEKPLVLSEKEFKEIADKTGFILYRGYSADSKKELAKYRENLKTGEFYVENSGGAVFGRGLYSAHTKVAVDDKYGTSRDNNAIAEAKAYSSARSESRVDRMTMLPDAKIVEYGNIIKEAEKEFLKGTPEWYQDAVKVMAKQNSRSQSIHSTLTPDQTYQFTLLDQQRRELMGSDEGGLAVMLGYDAIHVTFNDYFVILNRSKLVVSTTWYTTDNRGNLKVNEEDI